ncbi:hypothetical protein GY45DRAFT_935856 [Cubamyces sp. BRFM 1775]|nr:hypothetical protein GY45DRAFT_935856 [Cubamyces sp. BRFM 1775]
MSSLYSSFSLCHISYYASPFLCLCPCLCLVHNHYQPQHATSLLSFSIIIVIIITIARASHTDTYIRSTHMYIGRNERSLNFRKGRIVLMCVTSTRGRRGIPCLGRLRIAGLTAHTQAQGEDHPIPSLSHPGFRFGSYGLPVRGFKLKKQRHKRRPALVAVSLAS